jgi:predicted Rossmann fold nucleotide-binding protein DprA/Smf involved in DNA uptake
LGGADILEELNLAVVEERATPRLSLNTSKAMAIVPEQISFVAADDDEPEEQALLSELTDDPVHIDYIQRSSGLPISSVSSTLKMLELKGKIK